MYGAQSRAETFLKLYRILEGALEKRYGDGSHSSSVVMDYLRDEDSQPYRYELNLCREIRNILSHNADEEGEPVVEPSDAVIESLKKILDHVTMPRLALDYGTPKEQILWAHANDRAIEIMHRMVSKGYSHVPILDKGKIIGVFSVSSLFAYIERRGFDAQDNNIRIRQIDEALNVIRHGAEKYMFMHADATIYQARAVFQAKTERNSRLSAVFITEDGTQNSSLLAMLTPWDALKNQRSYE